MFDNWIEKSQVSSIFILTKLINYSQSQWLHVRVYSLFFYINNNKIKPVQTDWTK